MNKFNLKSFLIDIILLIFLVILFIFVFYLIYAIFPGFPRIFFNVFVLLIIPPSWGNMILSLLGKKSIGRKIVDKISKKYN